MDKRTEVFLRVNAIVVEHVGCEPSELEGDPTFADLSCDDLDMVELTIQLEEEYGIEISDEEVAQHLSLEEDINSVVDLIMKKLEAQASAQPPS